MFSLNPWVWVAGIILLFGMFTGGFLSGRDWEQGQQAMRELNKKDAVIKLKQKVTVGQEKLAEEFEKGRKSREDEFRALREELAKHQNYLMAMPASCDLPSDVVRLLNGPRVPRGPAANPGQPVDRVPPASGPPGRTPGNGGSDPSSGLRRSTGLPKAPQGPGGSGQVPGTAVQLTQGVTP